MQKVLILVSIVALLGIASAVTYKVLYPSTPASPVIVIDPDAVPVVANANTLTPSTFTVTRFATIKLAVTAQDADYTLTSAQLGISQQITKGQTVQLSIEGKQTGSFTIDCGPGCQATVTVPRQDD